MRCAPSDNGSCHAGIQIPACGLLPVGNRPGEAFGDGEEVQPTTVYWPSGCTDCLTACEVSGGSRAERTEVDGDPQHAEPHSPELRRVAARRMAQPLGNGKHPLAHRYPRDVVPAGIAAVSGLGRGPAQSCFSTSSNFCATSSNPLRVGCSSFSHHCR